MEKTIEIPEGYGARIEGDKVIIEKKESVDERIRKSIVDFIWRIANGAFNRGSMPSAVQCQEWLSYLEKQKELKPSWTEIDNSKESIVFPFNARVKDSNKIVTIIDGQLNFDGKKWIRFASNKDDGFKVYNPEDLLVEQKPAEWSDIDELKLQTIEAVITQQKGSAIFGGFLPEELIDFLKSLRPQPHWKPSAEQVSILGKVFAGCELNTSERDSMVDLFYHLKDMI